MFIDSTETINVQDIRFNEVTEGIDLKPKVMDKFWSEFNINSRESQTLIILQYQFQYKCEFCDKSFARKFNFDRHLQVHKQKVINVVCSECQKPFSNEANLKIHFNDVHNGKTMNSPERVVVAKRSNTFDEIFC